MSSPCSSGPSNPTKVAHVAAQLACTDIQKTIGRRSDHTMITVGCKELADVSNDGTKGEEERMRLINRCFYLTLVWPLS